MKIAGLTGSIGMGKSTVAHMLRDLGVPVFDADAAVHALQGSGGRLVEAIEAAFPGTTSPAGVDRAALGDRVLHDDAAMKSLEALIHPAVAQEREAFLMAHRNSPLVVFDIPLLFETGGDAAVDATIVVSASPDRQRARVLGRTGMTAAKFALILARQLPDTDKRERADYVIDTDGSHAVTRDQVAKVVACLLAREGR